MTSSGSQWKRINRPHGLSFWTSKLLLLLLFSLWAFVEPLGLQIFSLSLGTESPNWLHNWGSEISLEGLHLWRWYFSHFTRASLRHKPILRTSTFQRGFVLRSFITGHQSWRRRGIWMLVMIICKSDIRIRVCRTDLGSTFLFVSSSYLAGFAWDQVHWISRSMAIKFGVFWALKTLTFIF